MILLLDIGRGSTDDREWTDVFGFAIFPYMPKEICEMPGFIDGKYNLLLGVAQKCRVSPPAPAWIVTGKPYLKARKTWRVRFPCGCAAHFGVVKLLFLGWTMMGKFYVYRHRNLTCRY